MSSSCVPAKEPCVMHDPNPLGSMDNDRDTDSECGSLCTCTSSSMTSIATSVATCNHPNGRMSHLAGSSVSLSQPLSPPQSQSRQQHQGARANPSSGSAAGQATADPNGNPYIVVFVPPTMLPNRNSNCGNCRGEGALQAACRAYFLTALEFCPWVAGFVFIYYAFYWWGIGPGFSAFLLMMGSHALIRFIRTRGNSSCGIAMLSRAPRNNPTNEAENEEEEEEEEDRGNDDEEGSPDAPPEVVNESPPSYEVAVVKPPPYDLYHHLTPTQPRSQIQQIMKKSLHDNFLTVPDFKVKRAPSEADDDDVFLPSYQDAIRLSFRSENDYDYDDIGAEADVEEDPKDDEEEEGKS